MTDALIDRIYECSVVPELWPDVLDDLAALAQARGGVMFSARQTLNWTASDTLRPVFDAYVGDGWFRRCSRRLCLMSQTQPSFFVERDFWTDQDLDRDPIYRDFFRPRGLGWSAGTGLRIPTGDDIVFTIERDFERGPIEPDRVDALNALRPHLARSALVTARVGQQRAQGAAEILEALGLPAALLGDGGRAIQANPMIEALGDHVVFTAHGRVSLTDRRANDQLASTLASINTGAEPRSFPLRDGEGRAVKVVHVMPVRRTAQDVFGQSYALLLITPVAAGREPSIDLLRSLFDFTPSEARVAGGLATGKSAEEIAEQGGVAITTVRSQLRGVLEKTGCSRQAEAAALLAGSVTVLH